MKSILILAIILVAANSYTLWDNWHNVPTKWAPTPAGTTSNKYGLSGWTKNTPSTPHYSGMFNDYTQVFSQYLYWKNASPDTLIMCGPKYYLSSEKLCRVDPYFKTSLMPTYCIPNYFNYPTMNNICDQSNPLFGTYSCCYENAVNPILTFEKDMNSIDPYSVPLF